MPEIEGLDQLPGKSHYFTGNDRASGVPMSELRQGALQRRVSRHRPGLLRQPAAVGVRLPRRPGCRPKAITLSFEGHGAHGAPRLRIDNNGDLLLRTAGSELRQHKPVVYQEVDGVRRPIAGRYVLKGGRQVGFDLGAYDRSRPLVIDPVLTYATTGLGVPLLQWTPGQYLRDWERSSPPVYATPGAFQGHFRRRHLW